MPVKFTDHGEGLLLTVSAAGPQSGEGCISRCATRTWHSDRVPAPASFKVFHQVDGSSSRKHGGTGLGPRHLQAPGRDDGRGKSASPARAAKEAPSGSSCRSRASPPPRRSQSLSFVTRACWVADAHASSREALRELLAGWSIKADFARVECAFTRHAAGGRHRRKPLQAHDCRSKPAGLDGPALANLIAGDLCQAAPPLVLMRSMLQAAP